MFQLSNSDINSVFIVVVHPLSYGRGVLPDIIYFLTSNQSFIGNFKRIKICSTAASILGMKCSEEGWGHSLDSVGFVVHSSHTPDDLIGVGYPYCCKSRTLKGYLKTSNLSQYDSIVRYSNSDIEFTVFKELFSI